MYYLDSILATLMATHLKQVSTRAVNTLSTAKEGAALLTKMKRKSTGGAKADTGKKR